MAEEKKPEAKKKPNNKGKTPPINTNIIFFSILVIGIIIFTVILLLKPNVTVYRAQLAQNAECIVQVGKKDLDIGIKVDGEVVSQQPNSTALIPREFLKRAKQQAILLQSISLLLIMRPMKPVWL